MSNRGKVKIIDKLEIIPVGPYVLVEVDDDDQEELSSGRIIIPNQALQNKKTQTGIIRGVGPGLRNQLTETHERVPMDCEVGQRVLFACYIGYPMVINKVEFVIIKYNDIMAFVDEESHYVDQEDLPSSVELDDKRIR